MVQPMRSGHLLPGTDSTLLLRNKLDMEDSLEKEHGPLTKRSKLSYAIQEQWSARTRAFATPMPLGLRLGNIPSLLELLELRISLGIISTSRVMGRENSSIKGRRESTGGSVLDITDKIKASNFPASVLKIGCWEYTSRYEGDLVAKCYFSKQKLVWEVLRSGLKSKIEIQWSDIMALNANCPDSGPSTLTVVVARQPLFFKEINPQPRKHTLWQTASDFTDGQASIYRKHVLQCPQGLLSKHVEKLIQCDTRLNFLSQQPEIVLDSPYFESQAFLFEGINDSNGQDINNVGKSGKSCTLSGFQDGYSTSSASQSSIDNGIIWEPQSLEAPSPCSVMGTGAIEESGTSEIDSEGSRRWNKINFPETHPSMYISDFMSEVGHCISEQMNSVNPFYSRTVKLECNDIREDTAQYLLNDSQSITSDEEILRWRANSFYCRLQKDPATLITGEAAGEEPDTGKPHQVEPTYGSFQYNNGRVEEIDPWDDGVHYPFGWQ